MVRKATVLPDQEQRDLILRRLDLNVMVEAAAGTGKTTCMVGRMVALLRSGTCRSVRNLAAVTFTRKAAAELRSRFQVELERGLREAEGEERARLMEALDDLEHCVIGTIHSFCGRLLRERPVEAGVDVSFREIDEVEDMRLRNLAWEEFASLTLALDEHGLLSELGRLGLRLSELKPAFLRFADYPDVHAWPGSEEEAPLPEVQPVLESLREYLEHMRGLEPLLPHVTGNDKLIEEYRRLPRLADSYDDLSRPDQLMELLQEFDSDPKLVQKVWKDSGHFNVQQAKDEKERWLSFRDNQVKPMLKAWREHRYHAVMRVLFAARDFYDRIREEMGCLNFQDLLLKAARLLRDHPQVRRYFQERFTHILVDEFQDTDPIQAEVLLLLSSSDPEERDWRRCRPRPGSLFVVGDPKQSIYRFRRADIVTYNQAREIITGPGSGGAGMLVRLSTNFRAVPELIDWTNRVFSPGEGEEGMDGHTRFPAQESDFSPAYVELVAGMDKPAGDGFRGVFSLDIDPSLKNEGEVIPWEAYLIARFIRSALDNGLRLARGSRFSQDGGTAEAEPGDFMILARAHHHLGDYAQALQAYGIPHQVSGGDALNRVEELRLLSLFLRSATRPDDPVALLAVLRSELFGVSDDQLYEFKRSGGRFNYHSPLPEGFGSEAAAAIGDAFSLLRRCEGWLATLPPVSALERVVESLGLEVLAAGRPGGPEQTGSLMKALELLRELQDETWSHAQLVENIERLVAGEDKHDGIPARPPAGGVVRLMTLHRAKGLEAPVVFLADPYKGGEQGVTLAVDRSGEKVLGYLAVHGEARGYSPPLLLACPPGWEDVAAREREFELAERLRLRYVAATRAASALVISQHGAEGKQKKNFWSPFKPYLDSPVEINHADGEPKRDGGQASLTPEEAKEELSRVSRCLAEAVVPTYEVAAAKQLALTSPAGEAAEVQGGPSSFSVEDDSLLVGEHGVEWGSVIHLLLEAAARGRGSGLEKLAATALAENGLDPGLAGEALRTVDSVMGSRLWERSQKASLRLVEAPFHYFSDEGEDFPGKAVGGRLLLRGAIDLAFRENGGWVLVDFKTDGAPAERLEELARHYAPQLQLYSRIFEECTGETVCERVIYFVRSGRQFSV